MTKEEHKRLIDTLDVWVKECETFYNIFKDVFLVRPDAVAQLQYKCNQTSTINEFLFSGKFITIEKYIEVCDRLAEIRSIEDE